MTFCLLQLDESLESRSVTAVDDPELATSEIDCVESPSDSLRSADGDCIGAAGLAVYGTRIGMLDLARMPPHT